ncbi:sodium/hydrogen exchanger 4 [Canna indica]|uniref:Sodium/hydrogen exchanger 4 n=1 Tax=Canna indica TaxID=4628 RepID=A0AAQ3KXA0_9LILI|nr:sodium/hydrogen exchanger 4 [Canna indica]
MAIDLFYLARSFLDNAADHNHVVSISVFVAVLCLCFIVGHLLEENRWINESITAIVIGCITGTVLLFASNGKHSRILRFDEEFFFIYLLPPIIFNAGFQVKKKQFFQNFLTIMLFGVVGVFISFSIIAFGSWKLFKKIGFHGLHTRDYLAIGAIFSSTDTVCILQVLHQDETPRLYSLVFGEGVVNDATSVVLFNAIQNIDVTKLEGSTVLHVFRDFLYLFFTSTVLGIAEVRMCLTFIITKLFNRHSTDREIALMALMAYLSYTMAELFHLSGILTVFFCGIAMSHYAWHNVTENSRITARHIFATLSFIAEAFIFLYVGMDALDTEKWKAMKASFKTCLGIYSILVFLILLGRAAFVFPLSVLSNYISSRSETALITFRHQVIIWWAGLMRGAVSVALAFNQFTYSGVTWDPVYATMITSTIVVVLFSTLVFGTLTNPLVNFVLPHHLRNRNNPQPKADDATLPLVIPEEPTTSRLLQAKRSLTMLLERPVHTIHAYWRKFDDKYMRPVFGGPT